MSVTPSVNAEQNQQRVCSVLSQINQKSAIRTQLCDIFDCCRRTDNEKWSKTSNRAKWGDCVKGQCNRPKRIRISMCSRLMHGGRSWNSIKTKCEENLKNSMWKVHLDASRNPTSKVMRSRIGPFGPSHTSQKGFPVLWSCHSFSDQIEMIHTPTRCHTSNGQKRRESRKAVRACRTYVHFRSHMLVHSVFIMSFLLISCAGIQRSLLPCLRPSRCLFPIMC